jgi:hypothetical protein
MKDETIARRNQASNRPLLTLSGAIINHSQLKRGQTGEFVANLETY